MEGLDGDVGAVVECHNCLAIQQRNDSNSGEAADDSKYPPDDLQKLFHTLRLVNCEFVNAIYTNSLTSLQGSRSPTGSAPSVAQSAPVGTAVHENGLFCGQIRFFGILCLKRALASAAPGDESPFKATAVTSA